MIKAFFKIFLTKGQGTGKSVRSVGYNVGFVISKFFFLRYILLLLTWGKENRSLYRGLRYIRISPLSPNGDQHQFSPNDIHNLSRD